MFTDELKNFVKEITCSDYEKMKKEVKYPTSYKLDEQVFDMGMEDCKSNFIVLIEELERDNSSYEIGFETYLGNICGRKRIDNRIDMLHTIQLVEYLNKELNYSGDFIYGYRYVYNTIKNFCIEKGEK